MSGVFPSPPFSPFFALLFLPSPALVFLFPYMNMIRGSDFSPSVLFRRKQKGFFFPLMKICGSGKKKDPAFSDGILSDAEKIKNSGLANGAFQFVISGFGNKFREICSVVVFRADRIAFLDAFAGLSLVDDLGAFFVINFDVFSFLDVVEFHSRFSLVWLTVTHRVYQTW